MFDMFDVFDMFDMSRFDVKYSLERVAVGNEYIKEVTFNVNVGRYLRPVLGFYGV